MDQALVSDTFRMGMRETRAAMTRGALLAQVRLPRVQDARALVLSRNPEKLAGMLHDIAGPLNLMGRHEDVGSEISHRAGRASACAALAILWDLHGAAVAQSPASDYAREMADSFCRWIDRGVAVDGLHGDSSESKMISAFLTQQSEANDAACARLRLNVVLRFAPALGALCTVLDVPEGVIQPREQEAAGATEGQEPARSEEDLQEASGVDPGNFWTKLWRFMGLAQHG